MCNRARNRAEPETLFERFGGWWLTDKPRDNRFDPVELYPKTRAYVVREEDGERGFDVMTWDVLHGAADWPMTNVRNLKLPQWRKLAEDPAKRCLIPLTEFYEWTPKKIDPGDGAGADELPHARGAIDACLHNVRSRRPAFSDGSERSLEEGI